MGSARSWDGHEPSLPPNARDQAVFHSLVGVLWTRQAKTLDVCRVVAVNGGGSAVWGVVCRVVAVNGVGGGPNRPERGIRSTGSPLYCQPAVLCRQAIHRRTEESAVSLPPLVEPAAELTPGEVRRYSRHLIIPDVGMQGQQRLKNAKVLVIGAGGLGSPALLYLAAAGVGTLGVADFDEVDESNLQRQVIHGQSDVGRPKALSARESIEEVNPLVDVVVHQERLDNDNVLRILEPYDLVVDGTDNFATRYLVNDAAVLLGKPYVWGSIYRFDGQASVFWAEHGPCYRCLYPEPPPPGMVPSCAEGGVLGVLCASIGAIQATEAVKLLTGIGEPLIGSLMIYDALAMEYRKLRVRKDPSCALCGDDPTITGLVDYEAFCGATSEEASNTIADSTISVTTLSDWLEERDNGKRDFVLVDVREPNEFEINRIPGAVLIPKNEFMTGAALDQLSPDRQVVLHCKSGVRSAEALAVLKRAGFDDSVHVGGGIVAWVEQVDPTQPSY